MSETRMMRSVVLTALAAGALALTGCSAPTGAPATLTVTGDPTIVTKTVASTVKVTITAPASTVTAAPVTVTEQAAADAPQSAPPAAAASATQASETTSRSNLPAARQAAVSKAESYLDLTGFSRQGLIDQLSSEYGEKFSEEDATAAVDSLDVDWNAEAAESAKSYSDLTGFSCQGLIDQLSSEYGSQFTQEQAEYGATSVGLC